MTNKQKFGLGLVVAGIASFGVSAYLIRKAVAKGVEMAPESVEEVLIADNAVQE